MNNQFQVKTQYFPKAPVVDYSHATLTKPFVTVLSILTSEGKKKKRGDGNLLNMERLPAVNFMP